MSKKVINFEKAKQNITVTATSYVFRRKKFDRECAHHHLLLDESSRTAECDDCGDILDPFDILVDYMNETRKSKRDIARWEAAAKEFQRIQEGWSLTIAEKRRISKAMDQAKLLDNGDGE